MKFSGKIAWTIASVMFVLLAAAVTAFALTTAPAAGDFAFELYDVVANDILGGPIGIIAGIGALVAGAALAIQQKLLAAVPCLLGGIVILQSDAMIQSLGMMF
ncbi:MAG TPA: hypothetical protein PKY89_07775 [Deltaproteobacteria bacterium]|nr:hypothetical protein [Deltaproteobacteria bacterium]